MKSTLGLFLAFTFTFCLGGSLRAADTVEIKQQWRAGKKYYQSMKTDQTSTFAIGEQKMEQDMAMTVEATMTVKPAANGKPKLLTMRYERMAMDMSMNGQKFGFDSAKKDESDPLNMGKSLGGLVGKELIVSLSDKDEVVKVENYEEFIKGFGAAATPGLDPSKMFSEDSLKQMLEQGGLRAAPGKPVGQGATWPFDTEVSLPQMGKISIKGNYAVKSIGDHSGVRCAEVAADASIGMDLSGGAGADANSGNAALAALGMKVTDGTLKGTIWFDPELGMARDTQITQEMTISMKNPTDASATMQIPMKQKISVVLTKVEDVK